jgi:hypothetical protein
MIAKAAQGAFLALTAACTTAAPAEEEVPVHGETPGYRCDAAKAQHLVGRPADNDLGFDAQRLTGAAVVRWMRPGDIVTMEYRADRLNIDLDERHRVRAIRCG